MGMGKVPKDCSDDTESVSSDISWDLSVVSSPQSVISIFGDASFSDDPTTGGDAEEHHEGGEEEWETEGEERSTLFECELDSELGELSVAAPSITTARGWPQIAPPRQLPPPPPSYRWALMLGKPADGSEGSGLKAVVKRASASPPRLPLPPRHLRRSGGVGFARSPSVRLVVSRRGCGPWEPSVSRIDEYRGFDGLDHHSDE